MTYELLTFEEVWHLDAAVGLALGHWPWTDAERSILQEALDKLQHLEQQHAPMAQTRKEKV